MIKMFHDNSFNLIANEIDTELRNLIETEVDHNRNFEEDVNWNYNINTIERAFMKRGFGPQRIDQQLLLDIAVDPRKLKPGCYLVGTGNH